MTGARRLLGLAVANLVTGVVASLLAPIELPDLFGLTSVLPPFGLRRLFLVPLLASILSQAVLLALWGTARDTSRWMRAAGLVAGAVYLEALPPDAFYRQFLGLSTVTLAVTTAALLGLRALGLRLSRPGYSGQPLRAEAEGLKFSIRGLMVFTAAVAVLSAGARTLQGASHRFFLLSAVWAMCFVAVGFVAVWATLGSSRSSRRGAVLMALSPVLGGWFAFAAEAHEAGRVYIVLTMTLYAAMLLLSMSVVRACGYRFSRCVE